MTTFGVDYCRNQILKIYRHYFFSFCSIKSNADS